MFLYDNFYGKKLNLQESMSSIVYIILLLDRVRLHWFLELLHGVQHSVIIYCHCILFFSINVSKIFRPFAFFIENNNNKGKFDRFK